MLSKLKIKHLVIIIVIVAVLYVAIMYFTRSVKTGIIIDRKVDDGTQTTGKITVLNNGIKVMQAVSLELPFKNNARFVSAIPKGVYEGEIVQSSATIPYPHIWIKNVPGRGGIKIHKGNYFTQLLGCVLPGRKFTDLNKDGYYDVVDSAGTLSDIMASLPQKFLIKVK